jgi:P-type conjugative transfer protein TrbJ
MKKTRPAASVALALLSAFIVGVHVGPARALIVFDPANYGQNLLTAAHTLQQINNQIRSLQNEAQMILNQGQSLANEGRNLTALATSPLAMLQQDIQRTQQLIVQAKGLTTQVANLNAQFSGQYPATYGGASANQIVMDGRTRWSNSQAALATTLTLQAQVDASITGDQQTLTTVVGSSQGAVGILQATQATNQLLALMIKQSMQSQQLRIAQDRASALEQARALEADEEGRATRLRFQGSGVAYTPVVVQVYP